MPRGEYQVEDVEASKQPPQENSYKMCIVTIGIFLVICIILLLCTLPLKSHRPVSTDEYKADASEGTREIPEDGYQRITTKRTTLAKYQQGTTAIDQLPLSVTPHYEETENTKDVEVTLIHRSKTTASVTKESKATTQEYDVLIPLKGDDKNDNRTTASGTKGGADENVEDDETYMTTQYTTSTATPQQMPNKVGDEDIADKSNTSSTIPVLRNRTSSENDSTVHPYLHWEEVSNTPEVDKEQKYSTTPTFNDDKYSGTSSADKNNNQTDIVENTTPEVEDKEHVPLHEYEDDYSWNSSAEEKGNQTEEERNHEVPSTKPYRMTNKTGEDDVTVSTTPEYQNSTNTEQGSFVKHFYVHEEEPPSNGHTKDDEEEEYTQTTLTADEVEDNRATPIEDKHNKTANETEVPSTKPYRMTNKTGEDDVTVSTTPEYQNSTSTEQGSFVKHFYVHEKEPPTDGHTKDDEEEEYTQTTLTADEVEDNRATPIEEKHNQTANETEVPSTKPYRMTNETGEDDVTVSTTPEYQNSTSTEHDSFVKHFYVHEEEPPSDRHTKDDEEEEYTQTTLTADDVEENRATSIEQMHNQTANETEDEKLTTVQTRTLDQITNKDNEASTQSAVLSYQNQTNNENVTLVEERHMEEEMAVTNSYTKEDEPEHQLLTPVPNNNSTEDDKTGQENSTQTASELQNYTHKQSDEKQNADIKNEIHVTTLNTENKMAELITESALNTTNIKRSLQMNVSTDTPVCVPPNTSNATTGNVCLTSKCKSQAKHLMKTMSFNVDACEDFYEFACGDVRTNKYLQPENLEQNTWDRIHSSMEKGSSIAGEKFKSFYNQCLYYDSVSKEERIHLAIEILHTVGAFYNNTSWKTNPSNFTQLFLNMLQLHSAPLFDVLLDVDNTKGLRFDFQIIPPLSHSLFQDVAQTELQCREDILHAYRNKKTFILNTAYEEYMNCTLYPEDFLHKITEALEKLSAFESLDEEENTSLVRLRQAIEFSILPCKRSLPNKREMLKKLLTKDFHSITVKELNSLYPLIQWDILLKGLLEKEVPEDLVVQLYFKDYFDELFHNMETVEMYELHNAVLALFAHDLYFNLVETKSACHRPSYCLKVASTLMQDVSSFLYLSSFTNDELQNFNTELQEISKKIKNTFKHIVEEEDTLMAAQIKIDQMEIITDGGMNIFGAKGYTETLLNEIEIDVTDGYLLNAVKLTKRFRKKMYQLFFKNPRNYESIWTHFVHPYSFQPVAIYPLNMVVVPYGYLGALQNYDPLMGYMRNIRLAIPLAQHMIHHFDTTGKIFNVSSLNYEMFEYCLDLSYSSQRSWQHPETKQIMDFKVDAPLFHNQRLTDFLALRTVLESYKAEINSEKLLPWLELSQEQIYFLVFTQSLCTKSDLLEDVISLFEDEHLPPTLRVADIMSNSEEFGTSYHCGVGIAMNPENKCKLFTTEELASYVGSYEEVPKEHNANSHEFL